MPYIDDSSLGAESVEATEQASTEPPAAAATVPATASGDDSSGVPPWAWLLVVATLVALAAGAWLLQRRRASQEWEQDFEAAAGDAAWIARGLVPDLAQARSLQQRALIWGAASERVGALENRVAGLAATAREPEAVARAQALGNAVHQAYARLDRMIIPGDTGDLSDLLWTVARDLESAVALVLTDAMPAG